MKTLEEKRALCSMCKNRKYDLHTGIKCSLTGEKPTFVEACEDYCEDEKLVQKQIELENQMAKIGSMNGWLAYFLWIGIGLGATGSVILALYNIFFNESGWLPYVLIYIPLLSIIIPVAVGTIVAFYKKKPNAVALATVYLVMVGVDGLLGLILSLIAQEAISNVMQSVGGVVWAIFWGVFLYASETVRARIPVEKRKWGWFPITMISLFSILYLTFVCLSIIGVTLPA